MIFLNKKYNNRELKRAYIYQNKANSNTDWERCFDTSFSERLMNAYINVTNTIKGNSNRSSASSRHTIIKFARSSVCTLVYVCGYFEYPTKTQKHISSGFSLVCPFASANQTLTDFCFSCLRVSSQIGIIYFDRFCISSCDLSVVAHSTFFYYTKFSFVHKWNLNGVLQVEFSVCFFFCVAHFH